MNEKMDLERIDLIIKFALAAAGQEDDWNKELGPIHLVKYVYLADLVYAEHHHGTTYTGAPWRFHHFGPWVKEVFLRIEPVVKEIEASERRISSYRYEDDFCRYSLVNEELYDDLNKLLPIEITSAIKSGIREFGRDTAELLHYVYKTRPMLKAAPEELLSFNPRQLENDDLEGDTIEDTTSHERQLTIKEKKQRKTAMESLKETIEARLKEKLAYTPPRYDDVYFEGLKWLDRLAGESIEPEEGTLEISDSIWKSPFRTEDEIP